MTKHEKAQMRAMLREELATVNNLSVIGNTINGVHFDGTAMAAIEAIAEGLRETAQALGTLAYAFKGSNVKIGTLVNVGNTPSSLTTPEKDH